MEAAFYRANDRDVAMLPGIAASPAPAPRLFLAVTVTPTVDGLYVYASKSQALGKVAEVAAVTSEGTALAEVVIFPRGVEKPDPLRPGKTTSGYPGAFTALLSVTAQIIAGTEVRVRFTGLACTPVNCTPIDLENKVIIPDASAIAMLPDAAAMPWWSGLCQGVAEPMPGPASMDPLQDAPPLLAPTTNAFGVKPLPRAVPSDAFLDGIAPEPFSPGLEVGSLGKALLLGFLAGILLNLMPCVLPVLGIKLGALLRHGDHGPERVRRFRRHQVFFALGILVWFTVMTGLFHGLGLAWGQIFQSPAVVLVLAVLLLLLALNLFGVLTLPLIDFRAGTSKNSDMEAFAGGFAATLLATPCGGPLLGGVLSWALLQPLGVMAVTLESVGLGMAFPYLLLAAFPGLAERLPRPGSWMTTLERLLGFLLLGAVAYLVSFLPLHILPRVAGALVLAAFGAWLWGEGAKVRRALRIMFRAAAVAAVVAACLWPLQEKRETAFWQPYSHAAFGAEMGKRMILVDFTADWCPTCKVVEATALADSALMEWQKRYDLALFRVDMTQENPEGEALLRAVGSVSIPVIAVFRAGEGAHAPLVLRDVVTKGQVAAALELSASGSTRK